MSNAKELFERRRVRSRTQIRRRSGGRPRLSVFRSGKHIYAQVIDDAKGVTVAAASSIDQTLKTQLKNGAEIDAAGQVGQLIGDRASAAGSSGVGAGRGRKGS